jgi:hypothetical protein
MLAIERELTLSADQVRSRSAFRRATAATWGPAAYFEPGEGWDRRFNHGRGAYALPCERVRLECVRRLDDGAAAVAVRLAVDSPFHSVYQIGRSRVDVDAWRGHSTLIAEHGPGLVLHGTFPALRRDLPDRFGGNETWPAHQHS